jgi:tetratricopeptide (TPR) repeat protein
MNTPTADSSHREAVRSIWVFTPSRTAPEDLEAILVQRHDLIKDAVERVRESALTAHKHHLLFVGPRGCGKTHLVTLVVSRISADGEAFQRLRLAWLNEDETCTSLLELLIKIHTVLEKGYPSEFRGEDLTDAYELKPADALEFVEQRLLTSLGAKTLVVVAENLDALFESMGAEGQKQLRAFIQEHPQLAIVATAQRLVEDLSDRASPFFGFFQTEHLKPLSVDQATVLLQNIALVQGKKEVTEFLTTSRGRSRVRALHHLSGGNHRIYIVLSQFITLESMDTLIGPFMKMVDELTPYYQERVRWLPPLQRKIVEMLCACEGTVPVKEIARKLFSTPQTISSQLQSLREKGYVESSQRGRESLYEISEPLMRICVEVKENQNKQPLRLLVDFLRVWYDEEELERRLGLSSPNSVARPYFEIALERNQLQGNLRTKLLMDEIDGGECLCFGREQIQQIPTEIQEILLEAARYWNCDDSQSARQVIDEALNKDHEPSEITFLLWASSFMYWKQRNLQAEVSDLTRIISIPDNSLEHVAAALYNRGNRRWQQGDTSGEIADYSELIQMRGVPPKWVAMALVNRGIAHGRLGDLTAAIDDYGQVVALTGAPTEEVSISLNNLGVIFDQMGDVDSAIKNYTEVIELEGAPQKQVATAMNNRGFTYGRNGDSEAAILDYTQVITLPNAPLDQVSKALNNRGFRYLKIGRKKEARQDFEAIASMETAAHRWRADAHLGIAVICFEEGRWDDGFRAIERGLSIAALQTPVRFGVPLIIIEALFSAGLTLEGRSVQIADLFSIYTAHTALPVLGDSIVMHNGTVFSKGAPWPSADNLDQWLAAWAAVAGDVAEFKLPMRLLRTGIAFIKAGGNDHGVLLSLTSIERSILRQALGLETVER